VENFVGEQPRILLLDHDAARRARRCGQLAGHGWHVVEAAHVQEAAMAAASGHVDLALLEVSASNAADAELPAMLQVQAGGGYLPVIVLDNSEAGERDLCRCLDRGADEVLPTSVSAGELWARMKALLRIKELQDALDDSRQSLQDALRREHQLLVNLQADNDRLTRQAVTDPLTHLYNVRYFKKFLADEFKIARRYGHSLGLLTLDLDHFKIVNDHHGHPAGDFVLKEFSVLLRQSVRESDVVARTGGEEFAVILPRADRVQADHFARRIRQTVATHPFVIGPTKIKVTCSIGLACFGSGNDTDATSPQRLMYFADQALLAAKKAGRNCVVHWFEMDAAVKARLREQVAESPSPQGRGELTLLPAPEPPADLIAS
jgi:two-component system, cell cycle response regulator